MSHQSVLRLFAGFEVAEFERGPMMTFGLATLHSLLWVALFSEAKTTSVDHSLAGVFPYFHTRQSLPIANDRLLEGVDILSRSHIWHWRWSQVYLASLKSSRLLPFFVSLEEPVQLHWGKTNFFPAQKDVRTGGSGMPFQSLSHTRVALTIFWERVSICVHVICSCFLKEFI